MASRSSCHSGHKNRQSICVQNHKPGRLVTISGVEGLGREKKVGEVAFSVNINNNTKI